MRKQDNGNSKIWFEDFGSRKTIVIEKPFDVKRSENIESLYHSNKEIFDRYFPELLKVEKENKKCKFVFERINGRLFNEMFSLKNILNYKHILIYNFLIGKRLGQFHKEKLTAVKCPTILDELSWKIDFFEKNNPLLHRQTAELRKMLKDIECMKGAMIIIHRDFTPWNIMISDKNDIYFIDYFDARASFGYQDVHKYMLSIDLYKFDFYPPWLLKKFISSFLAGYKEEVSFEGKEYLIGRVIANLFYLTDFILDTSIRANRLKKEYLKKLLREGLRQYAEYKN